tara:strand:- start:180941 stop:181462 length:522 start_codon:yes stop_codon:yes gene_type:complete
MRSILTFTILFLLISCKETVKQNSDAETLKNTINEGNAAVQVRMEGKTHMLQQKDLNPIKGIFENDTLQFVFYTNDNPFQLNLNLNNTDLINKGSATYNIPEANAMKTKVDLNFFNTERAGKRMNRRIIFRKGTVTIKQLTKNNLQMTFEGEGGGMMDSGNNFPISGKVNVSY